MYFRTLWILVVFSFNLKDITASFLHAYFWLFKFAWYEREGDRISLLPVPMAVALSHFTPSLPSHSLLGLSPSFPPDAPTGFFISVTINYHYISIIYTLETT